MPAKYFRQQSWAQSWWFAVASSCQNCRRYFTPNPDLQGYDPALHNQALKLYLEGTSFRAIGRLLSVHHQAVINWVNQHAASLPHQVTDATPAENIEVDELFTYIGHKKTKST